MRYLVAIVVAALIGLTTLVGVVRDATFSVAEKVPTLLAVLLAAVLVRLARGMPTIPFDKIKPAQALGATAAFRLLLRSYTQCLIVITVAIVINLFAKSFNDSHPVNAALAVYAFLLFFFDAITVIVVYFLVSADMKISTIQADLMDQVTGASAIASAESAATRVRDAFKTEGPESPSVTPL